MRFVYRILSLALITSPLLVSAACGGDDSANPGPGPAADAGPGDSTTGTDGAGDTGAKGDGNPINIGAMVADTKGCHDCHDSDKGVMAGNTAGLKKPLNGAMVMIYPANLTPDDDTGIGHVDKDGWTDEQLARAIRTGVDDACLQLCSVMPKFPEINDSDMAALIAYLRSLPAVSNNVDMQGCPTLTATNGGGGAFVDAGNCPMGDDDDDDDDVDGGSDAGASDAASGG